MNILIVFAHPEPNSFNGAMKHLVVETLFSLGPAIKASDLYAMHWNAVAGSADFTVKKSGAGKISIAREQQYAMQTGTIAADIKVEQEKITWADMVIFQFPIWWFGLPAVLKGWVDRVFASGFAYQTGRKYDTGMFKGKLAMVSTTTGTSQDTYAPDGIDGSILSVLWPIHNGILRYTGFEVLLPFVAYMPAHETDAMRAIQLGIYQDRLITCEKTPRLFFHSTENFGANERLKSGVIARTGVQRNV